MQPTRRSPLPARFWSASFSRPDGRRAWGRSAGIYGVVGAQPANGGILLFVYSLGLGVPFLAVALLFGRAAGALRRMNRYYGVISIVSGVFLIGIGLLLLTDALSRLSQFAPAINLPGIS